MSWESRAPQPSEDSWQEQGQWPEGNFTYYQGSGAFSFDVQEASSGGHPHVQGRHASDAGVSYHKQQMRQQRHDNRLRTIEEQNATILAQNISILK